MSTGDEQGHRASVREESASDDSGNAEASQQLPDEDSTTEDRPSGAENGSESGADDEQESPSEEAGAAGDQEDVATETDDIRVRYFGVTDVGLVRDHNEDNFLVADLTSGERERPEEDVRKLELGTAGAVFAVCDGMGGAAAGEVASQMAVDTLYSVLKGDAAPASRDDFARRLVTAVEQAGGEIFDAAKQDRTRRGMGTTATVAGLRDRVLFVAQVGDSRAYVWRNGHFGQITKDQSLVNQLIEAGQLTEDEAEVFEHSNIILQALGTTEEVNVDLTFLELRRGDRLLVCSDGLSGMVHEDAIQEILGTVPDLTECCRRLVQMANTGGGHDNVTVVVAEFDGESLAPPDDLQPSYQPYPLPPEDEHEAAATSVARESTGEPDGRAKAGSVADRHAGPSGGRAARRWMGALAVALGVAGVAAWSLKPDGAASGGQFGEGEGAVSSSGSSRSAGEPGAGALDDDEPVEVAVRTDVTEGELFIDDRSYGRLRGRERIAVELRPGAHRFEVRNDGSVIVSVDSTVRAEVPAKVALMVPAGRGSAGVAEAGAAAIRDDARARSEEGEAQPEDRDEAIRDRQPARRVAPPPPPPEPPRQARTREGESAVGPTEDEDAPEAAEVRDAGRGGPEAESPRDENAGAEPGGADPERDSSTGATPDESGEDGGGPRPPSPSGGGDDRPDAGS